MKKYLLLILLGVMPLFGMNNNSNDNSVNRVGQLLKDAQKLQRFIKNSINKLDNGLVTDNKKSDLDNIKDQIDSIKPDFNNTLNESINDPNESLERLKARIETMTLSKHDNSQNLREQQYAAVIDRLVEDSEKKNRELVKEEPKEIKINMPNLYFPKVDADGCIKNEKVYVRPLEDEESSSVLRVGKKGLVIFKHSKEFYSVILNKDDLSAPEGTLSLDKKNMINAIHNAIKKHYTLPYSREKGYIIDSSDPLSQIEKEQLMKLAQLPTKKFDDSNSFPLDKAYINSLLGKKS